MFRTCSVAEKIYGTVWGPDDRAMPGIRVNIRKAGGQEAPPGIDFRQKRRIRATGPGGGYIVRADLELPKGRAQPRGKGPYRRQ